ncbi:hypothetical protein Tco_0668307 [Tanacetum coccineum]
MDTTYGRRWIRCIGNCEYKFNCEELALIRCISFPGYGVLVRNGNLDEAQKAIDLNPSCSLLRDEHAHYLMAFKESSLDEEISALVMIEIVQDSSNVRHEGNAVASAFVSHYEQFLGIEGTTTPLDDHGLSFRLLSDHKAEFMVREVSNSEIKGALFSMGNAKAPGPDGFTTAFFKKSWDIVGISSLTVPSKVAWEAVCLPQREGGLGIRRIEDFNIALMATHIWCILINKESLWVQWIHSYKLQGRSFWDVPCLGDIRLVTLFLMVLGDGLMIVHLDFQKHVVNIPVYSLILLAINRWKP